MMRGERRSAVKTSKKKIEKFLFSFFPKKIKINFIFLTHTNTSCISHNNKKTKRKAMKWKLVKTGIKIQTKKCNSSWDNAILILFQFDYQIELSSEKNPENFLQKEKDYLIYQKEKMSVYHHHFSTFERFLFVVFRFFSNQTKRKKNRSIFVDWLEIRLDVVYDDDDDDFQSFNHHIKTFHFSNHISSSSSSSLANYNFKSNFFFFSWLSINQSIIVVVVFINPISLFQKPKYKSTFVFYLCNWNSSSSFVCWLNWFRSIIDWLILFSFVILP